MKLKTLNIMKLEIMLGGKRYSSDLESELSIDKVNINNDMIKQPGRFAWFAVLCNMAEDLFEKKKLIKKTLYAELDKKYREGEVLNKITDKSVEQAIMRDNKYIKLSKEVLEAKLNYALLKTAVDAFHQKKDMLISIGANLREDMESNISILKEKARRTLKHKRKKF